MGASVLVRFLCDTSASYRGFNMSYVQIPTTTGDNATSPTAVSSSYYADYMTLSQTCDGGVFKAYLYGHYGSVYTPGYSKIRNDYPSSTDCSWTLRNTGYATKKRVTLKIYRLELEEGADFIEVRDGADAAAPLLEPYTGDYGRAFTDSVVSGGDALFVTFHSDASVVYDGFYFEFSIET